MYNPKIYQYISFLLLSFLLFSHTVKAQADAAKYQIGGVITDSTSGKALPFITITLLNDKKAVIATKPGSEKGEFGFKALQPAVYSLQLDAVGYTSKTITVNIAAHTEHSINLGNITMQPQSKGLKEVVVTGRRPVIKQEVDRISYDLQADPESLTNNVLDMMRKVPYLSLDGEGNILLKGRPDYRIFINGKPSAMVESNPREILRTMPASTIQRIEVITIPPSRYDAEGLAGIINIITNKKISNGYNGAANFSERLPAGGPGMGGSVNIKQGKLGIAAFGGGNLYRQPKTAFDLIRTTDEAIGTRLQQEGTRKSDSRSGYFGTELSYERDSLHLVSAQFNLNGYHNDATSDQSAVTDKGSTILQQYSLQSNNESRNSGLDVSFNYQLGFKADKRRLLTFSYRYFKYHNDLDGALLIDNRNNYAIPDYNQSNKGTAAERTFQVDYVRPVKSINIEAGVKAILRSNGSDFQTYYFNSATGLFERDPGSSNRFDNQQNIYSAYNTYSFSWKGLDVKTGARAEKTFTHIDFVSSATKVHQHYFNLIPTAVINKRFKNSTSINLGFNQRIKRPGINRLNPFVDRSNPAIEVTGNPALKPVTLNNLQLSYGLNKKLSLNTGFTYSWVKNLDLKVSVLDPVTNITRITYQNTGKGVNLSFDYNVSYPVTKAWNTALNGNLSYFNVEGLADNKIIRVKKAVTAVNFSTGYKFSKGWRANGNAGYVSRSLTDLQSTANGFLNSSVSLSKSLLKDKLSFSAFCNNPFTRYRANERRTEGTDFIELSTAHDYFRIYGFSVNYRFGKLKEAIKKNARGIRNDDLSN